MSDDRKPFGMNNHSPRTNRDGERRDSKSFGRPAGGERKSFGDRKPAGGERSSFGGERKSFGDRKPAGERSSFGGERKSFGDRKPAGTERSSFGGERKSFGDRKPANTERSSFGGERKSFGDRKPAGGERSSFGGERKSFGDRKPAGTERSSFGGERKSFGDRKPASTERSSFGGERKSFGDRKPAGTERSSFGGERKSFGDRKPAEVRPAAGGERKFFGDRKPAGGVRRPVSGVRTPFGAHKTTRTEAPVNEGLATRRMAWQIIHKVTEEGAYASLVLDEKLRGCGLSPEDRRLVSRLVYDTLENLYYIDEALNQVMARPDTDRRLVNILRLAACQLMLEDRIPESAAVNTAVSLCKEQGMEGLSGVCNGILRNLIRKKDELVWPDPDTDPIHARSVKYSVPEWLVSRLDADWGVDMADALMGVHQQESVTVRPNLLRLDEAEFEAMLNKKVWKKEPASVPYAWHISGMADIGSDTDFVGGNFSIQGESSMMACLALEPKRGSQVLDACAAPGGKACFIAELMAGTGRVQAWELHEHRTALIAAQARRLGLENIRPVTRDATKLRSDMVQTMDAVLVDAPCSGLGTMADKPDVKLHIKEESISELTALQEQILENCSSYVKPGGVLVYSTCSVLKDENEHQVSSFLARHPEFKLEKLPVTIPEQYRRYEDIGLQLLPCRDNVGGFYIARMRRSRV